MITTLLLLSGMAEATTPIVRPKPTAEQRALYDALKVRDDGPSCEALAALSQDIASDLIWIVDHATQPPWAGIRAARCILSDHLEAKATDIDAWVVDPSKKGLALLTLSMLDEVPEPAAVRFATLALDGPLADDARSRLVDSVHPAVANLAAPTAAPVVPQEPKTDVIED